MAEPFIGEIRMFAGNFAPTGWAPCDGRLLPISQYSALFSLLGTAYGGNGTSNFAVPDLRGRVAMNAGAAPGRTTYAVGQAGGFENTQLQMTQIPAHTHVATAMVAINVNAGRADQAIPKNNLPAGTPASAYTSRSDGSTMAPGATTATVTVQPAGSATPTGVPTLPPYQCVSFIIALQGIYPSKP
jgi:microcystin-dependent protein